MKYNELGDLREAAHRAARLLRVGGYKHVVYAYTLKTDPTTIHVADWNPLCFPTDEAFAQWYNRNHNDIDFAYAVHRF